jgi:hypothetical protein
MAGNQADFCSISIDLLITAGGHAKNVATCHSRPTCHFSGFHTELVPSSKTNTFGGAAGFLKFFSKSEAEVGNTGVVSTFKSCPRLDVEAQH